MPPAVTDGTRQRRELAHLITEVFGLKGNPATELMMREYKGLRERLELNEFADGETVVALGLVLKHLLEQPEHSPEEVMDLHGAERVLFPIPYSAIRNAVKHGEIPGAAVAELVENYIEERPDDFPNVARHTYTPQQAAAIADVLEHCSSQYVGYTGWLHELSWFAQVVFWRKYARGWD